MQSGLSKNRTKEEVYSTGFLSERNERKIFFGPALESRLYAKADVCEKVQERGEDSVSSWCRRTPLTRTFS